MVHRGRVTNGVVVLNAPGTLPEGAEVRVELVREQTSEADQGKREPTLGQKLLRHAGKAVGLPEDAARNHDHYLYGTPSK